jgi:transposase
MMQTSDSMRVWWHSGELPKLREFTKGGQTTARYHLGVDVSKHRHKACIRDLVLDSYSSVFSISVDRQGFDKFVSMLENLSQNREDFLIGIEATGNYGLTLACFLLTHGYPVVEINPYRANQFRKAQGKKAKTDRIDARSLSTILSLGNHKRLFLPDPILDNLKELTRFRTDMVRDRTRLVNQLHETICTIFPEIASIFSELDSPSCLSLLLAYPGPEYICRAGESKVLETIKVASRGKLGLPLARVLVEAAKTTVGALHKQPAMAIKVSILGERIMSITAAIEKIEKEIADLFRQLPFGAKDFPVGDIPSLATIISEVDDIHRFATVKQFLSHFGWCPQTFHSGSYKLERPRMSHAGNRYVRRIIWMLSIVAMRSVPRYRAYFERRVKEGKSKMNILVAIGRKLLSVFYAILKRGIPYDPDWEVKRHSALARS